MADQADHSNNNDDDPFGVFGDDGDDGDDDGDYAIVEEETDIAKISRSLVHRENQRLLSERKQHQPEATSTSNASSSDARASLSGDAASSLHRGDGLTSGDGASSLSFIQNSNVSPTNMDPLCLPWPDPLYLGPMVLASTLAFGGGRGYVAKQDVEAGTLLLVEAPLVSWPVDGGSVDLDSIFKIFGHANAAHILHAMEHFHPLKVQVDSSDDGPSTNPVQVEKMIEMYKLQYEEDGNGGNESSKHLERVVAAAAEMRLENSNGTPISTRDVLRLLVALRYNSLQTGIYLHVAMLNHADFPNCVKFLPTGNKSYSEVRTTRPVRAGEALTISYIPRLLSHASRRKYLWEQHRFDIGRAEDIPSEWKKLELVNKQLPPSNLERTYGDETLTHRIEVTTAELEDQCREISSENRTTPLTPDEAERAKALELASLELYTAAVAQLGNSSHLLLLPCLQLHLDACDLVQRRVSLPSKQRIDLLGRLIVTAQKLLRLQELVLGCDHFDLARTQLDLAQAVEELLSRAPNHLDTLFEDGPRSITDFSSLEAKTRKRHEQIKLLYPNDTESHIKTSQ
jgi:SET domain